MHSKEYNFFDNLVLQFSYTDERLLKYITIHNFSLKSLQWLNLFFYSQINIGLDYKLTVNHFHDFGMLVVSHFVVIVFQFYD